MAGGDQLGGFLGELVRDDVDVGCLCDEWDQENQGGPARLSIVIADIEELGNSARLRRC
jgi:hypothetical protein